MSFLIWVVTVRTVSTTSKTAKKHPKKGPKSCQYKHTEHGNLTDAAIQEIVLKETVGGLEEAFLHQDFQTFRDDSLIAVDEFLDEFLRGGFALKFVELGDTVGSKEGTCCESEENE